jgi:hypothetical protein
MAVISVSSEFLGSYKHWKVGFFPLLQMEFTLIWSKQREGRDWPFQCYDIVF